MKHYFTINKMGERVEVDYSLAKELVQTGKKKPEDFDIIEDGSNNQAPKLDLAKENQNMNQNIQSARQDAIINEFPTIAPGALALSETFAPNSYNETMQGNKGSTLGDFILPKPGGSPATSAINKDWSVATQTVPGLLAPISEIPAIVGRIGAMGLTNAASYLGSNENPTLSGIGIAAGSGVIGQGAGEVVQGIGSQILQRTLGLKVPDIQDLAQKGILNVGSTSNSIVSNIKNFMQDLTAKRNELLSQATNGSLTGLDVELIKRNIINTITEAKNQGYISPAEFDKFNTQIVNEFNSISNEIKEVPTFPRMMTEEGINPGITPSYAFNRGQTLMSSVRGNPQAIQDVVGVAPKLRYAIGSGINQALNTIVPEAGINVETNKALQSMLKTIDKTPETLMPTFLGSTLYNVPNQLGIIPRVSGPIATTTIDRFKGQ